MAENILRCPDAVLIEQVQAQKQGNGVFTAGDVVVSASVKADRLAVSVTALKTPVCRVRLRWVFNCRLKGQVLGDAWERSYADLKWRNITPYKILPWYALVKTGDETTGYGVMVRPSAICSWQIDPEGITLHLDVRCGGEGVELKGRELIAAEVVCRQYQGIRPFEAAHRFCRVMCTDPILPPAPVYGANNWYYAYGHSSREDVLRDAAYLEKLTEGVENRPYFVIDDGWQTGRYQADGSYNMYNGGPWLPNKHFGDMKSLAEEIRAKYVMPGIWIRPLQDWSESIPDSWRMAGTNGLDPSIPEVLDFVKETVERIGGWGYRLLKHDFTTNDVTNRWGSEMPYEMAEDGWHFADRSRTTAEILKGLYRAILEAAQKHDMLILGCNAVGHLGAGLMHMQRTGDDTSGLMWERTLAFGVNTLAFRMPQHGAFFDIDADCIGISPKIDWAYNRQWGELVSRSGTSLFYSVRPYSLPEDQERMLSDMLRANAVRRAPAEPLDWQDTPLPQDWLLDGEKTTFHWYKPTGLSVLSAPGPVFGKVWEDAKEPDP